MTLMRPGQAAAAAIALLALAGCDAIGNPFEVLAVKRPAPDEFQVIARDPLRMPRSAALPEPRPGAPSPLDPDPHRDAAIALLGSPAQPVAGHSSAGEQALLAAADAAAGDPEIRTILESDRRSGDDGPYEPPSLWELLGATERSEVRPEDVIDPTAESRRLQTEGVAATPVDPDDLPEAEDEAEAVQPSPYPDTLYGTRNKLPSSRPTPAF